MAIIVQKFGGSSVADKERLYNAARIVAAAVQKGHHVAVVVSAQGDTTDTLLAAAADVSPHPPARELDMLLATGEQAAAALLCMALSELGVPAAALCGWQAGFHTDGRHGAARLGTIRPKRVRALLDAGRVAVVAGFQGVDAAGDLTTLGRGGSDTSAVALAAALHAQDCLIYTDVAGVYTADPRLVPQAACLPEISCREMLALAHAGAQVLHPRSVELACRRGVPLRVLSSLQPGPGTAVKKTCAAKGRPVTGVALDRDICRLRASYTDGRAPEALLQRLAQAALDVRWPQQGQGTLQLLVPLAERRALEELLMAEGAALGLVHWHLAADAALLTLVGGGAQSDADVLPRFLRALDSAGQSPRWHADGPVSICALVEAAAADRALQAVHAAFFGGAGA